MSNQEVENIVKKLQEIRQQLLQINQDLSDIVLKDSDSYSINVDNDWLYEA